MIDWQLQQQTIAIVGGCGGIGRALTQTCLDNQMRVAVLDLPRSIAENPVDDRAEMVIALDAAKKMDIVAAFAQLNKHWPNLNHLVCLQGFTSALAPLENLTLDTWEEVMDVNLRSVWLCCKYAMPLLRQAEQASVVLVSSGIGNLGSAGYGPYAVAKGGLQTLTKILAREGAPRVRANAIAPGAVLTPFLGKGTGRGGQQGDAPERVNMEQYLKMVPAGYVATPQDIADPILFLMSHAARYLTGQILHVNGGALMP